MTVRHRSHRSGRPKAAGDAPIEMLQRGSPNQSFAATAIIATTMSDLRRFVEPPDSMAFAEAGKP